MTKVFCDRCKKEMTPFERSAISISNKTECGCKSDYYDLCKECFEKIWEKLEAEVDENQKEDQRD